MSNMGRPPIYENAEELQKEIEKYIKSLKKRDKPTISGLCFFLGFASRQSFYDLEKKNDNFSYTIKRAKLFIQQHYERQLNYNGCTGAIFALKNFGWSDKLELTGSDGDPIEQTINIKFGKPDA